MMKHTIILSYKPQKWHYRYFMYVLNLNKKQYYNKYFNVLLSFLLEFLSLPNYNLELMYKLLHIRGYILSSSGFHSRHQQVSALSFHVFRFLNFHHFHLKCPPLFCSITEHINI